MTTIAFLLALTAVWYIFGHSVPRSKRGLTDAICKILLGCSLIAIAINLFNF
jgi:hypothetical protein